MRYKYRNKVNGAEFETNSRISGHNWELVGADDPVVIPATEPADPDPVIPDPEDNDEDLADFDDIIPEVVEEKPKPKAKKTAKKPAKKGAKK